MTHKPFHIRWQSVLLLGSAMAAVLSLLAPVVPLVGAQGGTITYPTPADVKEYISWKDENMIQIEAGFVGNPAELKVEENDAEPDGNVYRNEEVKRPSANDRELECTLTIEVTPEVLPGDAPEDATAEEKKAAYDTGNLVMFFNDDADPGCTFDIEGDFNRVEQAGVLLHDAANAEKPSPEDKDEEEEEEEPAAGEEEEEKPDCNPDPEKPGEVLPEYCKESIECSASNALGFLLCPFLELVTKANEQFSKYINDLLFVSPLDRNDTENGGDLVYQVWSNIRNFANVLFIFALFAILYSQATSVGMSAYGVKRALPKLVAGAILANLSFFLCAIAVDMFNVLGGGINGLVDAAMQVPAGAIGEGDTLPEIFSGPAVLAIAGTIGFLVILFTATWSLVLLLLLVAVFTLVARQALIIILVIASPIAFAAWVLPNTEQYFSQWFKLFFSALLMYPLVVLVLAGSRLAAHVFSSIGDGNPINITLGILIAFLPMLALPALFKVGSYSLSKIGNMARGSAVGKGVEGFGKRKQDNLEARMANNQWANSGKRWQRGIGKGMRGVGNYKNRRQFKIDRQAEMAKRLQDDTTAGAVAGSDRFAKQAAGPSGRQGAGLIQARALEQQEKTDQEYRDAAKAYWRLKYPKDMESLAQELYDGAKNGNLSNTQLQGGLSALLHGGGPGRNLAGALYGEQYSAEKQRDFTGFMEGFAGESQEKAQQRYDAAMKVAADQDFEVFDEQMSHMAGQIASYQKGTSTPKKVDLRGAGPVKDSDGNVVDWAPDAHWSGAESRKMLTGDGNYGRAMQDQIDSGGAIPSQLNLELTMKSPKFGNAHRDVQEGVKQALAKHDSGHELLQGWTPNPYWNQ